MQKEDGSWTSVAEESGKYPREQSSWYARHLKIALKGVGELKRHVRTELGDLAKEASSVGRSSPVFRAEPAEEVPEVCSKGDEAPDSFRQLGTEAWDLLGVGEAVDYSLDSHLLLGERISAAKVRLDAMASCI